MRFSGLLVCACLASVALTACGGGQRGPDRRDNSMVVQQRADGTQVAVRPGRDPNAAYIQATELKAKGDCAGAILLLRPVAKMGPGYENAQTALGECLIQQGSERDEGLTWLVRAADAGWPEAQAALALAYGADSPARNGEEAAYWLALYDINPSKARVGFRAADAKALSTLRGSLSDAEKAAGARRAAAWQRKLWLPPADAEGPGLKAEQRGRGGFRGPPPQL
jgi:hypothetical protein